MNQSFSILVVCTGNICRSPVGERVLAERLGRGSQGIRVSSAGTAALIGDPMSRHSAHLLEENGYSSSGFTAHQLTEGLLGKADLVLTMEVAQWRQAARLMPRMAKRIYTVVEFSRALNLLAGRPEIIGDHSDVEGPDFWHAVMRACGAIRSAVDRSGLDIADPYGQGEEAFVHMWDKLIPHLERICEFPRQIRSA